MEKAGKTHWFVALLVLAIYLFLFVSGIQRQMQQQRALQQSVQRKSVLARLRL